MFDVSVSVAGAIVSLRVAASHPLPEAPYVTAARSPVTGSGASVETATFCGGGLAFPIVSLKATAAGLTCMLALDFPRSEVPQAPFQDAANTHRTRATFSPTRTDLDAIRSTLSRQKDTLWFVAVSIGENRA